MNGFVFREAGDGTLDFVGDFEALYRAEADPWEQSGRGARTGYYAFSRRNLLARMACHLPMDASCLEIGSGHGHLTAMLDRAFGRAFGMDISPAAIERAGQFHPHLRFIRGDITAGDFCAPGRFDCVVLAQCWWYVLHEVDRALENALSCVEDGGLLAVNQALLAEQRYGKNIADGFAGMLAILTSRRDMTLVECMCQAEPPFMDALVILRREPAAC